MAVIHPWLTLNHRILISAEKGQTFSDKLIKNMQGLIAGNGKIKSSQLPKMIGATHLDKGQNFGCDRIGCKAAWRRHIQSGLWRLAIIGIIIPFAANRLITFHQHLITPPQIAVEKFHAKRFSSLSPFGKITKAAKESCIGTNIDSKAKPRLPARHFIGKPIFPRCADHNPIRGKDGNRRGNFASKRASIIRIIKPAITNRDIVIAKRFGKMAHRRKQIGYFPLMMFDIGDLGHHFGHQHQIFVGIEICQAWQITA